MNEELEKKKEHAETTKTEMQQVAAEVVRLLKAGEAAGFAKEEPKAKKEGGTAAPAAQPADAKSPGE